MSIGLTTSQERFPCSRSFRKFLVPQGSMGCQNPWCFVTHDRFSWANVPRRFLQMQASVNVIDDLFVENEESGVDPGAAVPGLLHELSYRSILPEIDYPEAFRRQH